MPYIREKIINTFYNTQQAKSATLLRSNTIQGMEGPLSTVGSFGHSPL